MQRILPVLLAIAILGTFASNAYAYTATHTEYAKCSGGTALTTQTQATNGCVAYCAGLTASCCTTRQDNFGTSYLCSPYTNTTSVVSQSDTCGPNPDTCTNKHFSADVINYSAQPDLAAGSVTPPVATANISVSLSATISNVGGAATGAGFTNLFQRATDASGSNAIDIGTSNVSALAASGNSTASTTYTFPSAGTWYVRACADKSGAASTGTIAEANENNNCGSWTSVTVAQNLPELGAGVSGPTTATVGTPAALVAVITNNGTASTGAGFTNLSQRATTAGGANATDIGTHNAATLAAGANTMATFSYTFTSAGTWYIRTCADKNSASGSGTITELYESNNCGSWTAVTVSLPTPSASLSASPTSISAGQSTTLTWSSTNATQCAGTNFNTGYATAESTSVSPTTNTTYSVNCDGAVASVTVSVSSGPPNSGTYGGSQIAGQFGGNTCGTDVSGGSGTMVSGGYYNGGGNVAGQDPNLFPSNFFNYPTRFCYQEKETWVNGGTDTINQYEWRLYTANYVSNPSLPTLYASSWPGKNNERFNYSFYLITPTTTLSAAPSSIVSGNSSTLTWSSTNATSCTGTNFSTGNAASGSVVVSPSSTTSYTVTCTGPGGSATSSVSSVTVTAGTIDFTSGTPSLNSGSLVSGLSATFKGNVTNGGTGNTSATFSNRFQIDLSNNGSWDTTLDATNSITGLNSAQSKQVVSPSWTVQSGTHAVRLCADSPTSVVSESNEGNNCGASYVFTVSAPPNAPVIGGSTTGYTNTSYQFSFAATDPSLNTVRYAVDWDNNDVVDEYLPATGYITSGSYQYASRTWTTTGAKTLKAYTQNSLGANSGWTSFTITISTSTPPAPTALLTVNPTSIQAGQSTTITWSSSNATSCTGSGFSTGGATSGSVSSGILYTTTTFSVTCSGITPPPASNSATVTVAPAPDFISGIPGLNSGTLYAGQTLTFWANVQNQGTANTAATFSNRFQVDLNNNGSWDNNLDASNSITSLAINESKQVVSPSWTAVLGTHSVRMCADSPISGVAETNESNNCSTSYFTFTVTQPQCADGIDNNSNGLVDTADNACTDASDPTEEVLPPSNLVLTAHSTVGLSAEGIVRKSSPASLQWSVTDVEDDSCTLTGDNGDSWTLTGSSGTKISSPITKHTAFTLHCLDLNLVPVQIVTEVNVAPIYEEI